MVNKVGAWATKIFDNDITMDILAEYKILLGYGISQEESYKKIVNYFGKDFIGTDYEDDYWLGIAYFQWQNGILKEEVKENALRCIYNENFLEKWKESGDQIYQKRRRVLDEFKDKLLNEIRPIKRKFPKCPSYYREKTDWRTGDLIAYKIIEKISEFSRSDDYNAELANDTLRKLYDNYFLLRVIDVKQYPVSRIIPNLDYSSEPIIMVYDWYGKELPTKKSIINLKYKALVASIQSILIDESGSLLENPTYIKKLVSGVYLSKGRGKVPICETMVLENDCAYKEKLPDFFLQNPYLQSLCDPSQLNYILARTYTQYKYKEEFWKYTFM